jgi:ribose-phosphate pyrophosphokinase
MDHPTGGDGARIARDILESGRAPARPKAIIAVAVKHALFLGNALAQARAAVLRQAWSSDSVPRLRHVIKLAPLREAM